MARLGVCSWSLQPTGPADLVKKVRACGLSTVQLALDPIRAGDWDEGETVALLDRAGIAIASGMMATAGEDYTSLESIARTGGIRPDEHWEANLAAAEVNAALARRLGLTLVTLHAGFLPHDEGDPERARMLDRLRAVSEIFEQRGVRVGLETGQESAETLVAVLRELDEPNIGVNFDPANMILYGMGEPVTALEQLLPWVVQVHIKDATPSPTPGQWGAEVPVGTGAVNWPAFFDVLRGADRKTPMMIEREAGEDRVGDIRIAASRVHEH